MRARIASLIELDEMIGRHVLAECPDVHWQDSHSLFRFDSEQEAKEAIRDTYYQLFLPEADWTSVDVSKVHVFRPYSTDAQASWDVVQFMAKETPLQLEFKAGTWVASFGDRAKMSAQTALVAICLAALRANGIEVELARDFSG